MKNDPLSFSDVEQLLTDLAQHDLRTERRDDAQTELMRKAARGEIRRVFFRRRCLRVAGSLTSLALLGAGAAFLLPEAGTNTQDLATALPRVERTPAPVRCEKAAPSISYSTTISGQGEACEVVIYAVPL